ncbi:carbohydrate ABC transporter permease [Streptomyces sp. NPDC088747]|uniref:carbohydrate ABC transporter permease n=1 Tax=Streptomyces sp. NPDC088747 TaxID=3365886 RepID=UPI00381E85F6
MATVITTKPPQAAPLPSGRRRGRPSPGRVLAWVVLALVVLITIFPFYWMLRTALSNGRALATAPDSLLPVQTTVGAFERVLGIESPEEAIAQGGAGTSLQFWQYLLNSVIVSVIITVCQVSFSALAAYGFSRLKWRGRDTLFNILLTALMVPGIFTLLPNFVLIRNLGLLNSYLGIVAPSLFMTPFALFFLRQFFIGLPREVEEAALIDGAGRFRIFTRIIVPMSMSPLATLAFLTYITAWNDYLWPLIVGSDDRVRTLTVAIGVFQSQTPSGSPDWPGLMAATLIAAVPVLILFAFLGRRIVDSLGFSGVK